MRAKRARPSLCEIFKQKKFGRKKPSILSLEYLTYFQKGCSIVSGKFKQMKNPKSSLGIPGFQ
jgi:hypothetical protein